MGIYFFFLFLFFSFFLTFVIKIAKLHPNFLMLEIMFSILAFEQITCCTTCHYSHCNIFCQLSPLGNTYCISTCCCFGAVIIVSLVKSDLILLVQGLVLPLLEREYFAATSTRSLSLDSEITMMNLSTKS